MFVSLPKESMSAAALIVVLGFAPGLANATAYSFASNQITNSQTQVLSGSVTIGTGDRSNVNQTTYNGAAGPNGSDTVTQPLPNAVDAGQAYSGPNALVVPENTFGYEAGKNAGLDGLRSDSSTLSGNPFVAAGGTVTSGSGKGTSQVNNVSEGQVSGGALGTGDGRNTANSTFTVNVGPGGAALQFSFTDDYALYASTTSPGEVAQTTLGVSFTLLNSSGVVFSYAPDALNETGSSIGGGPAFEVNPGPTAFLSGIATLDPGTYNASLRVEAQSNLSSSATAISEPASLALVGAGLGAVGLIRRRKRL